MTDNNISINTFETNDMKKMFQFYPTPRNVAELICDMAELSTAENILEPSCGKGNLADVIYERNQNLSCIELNCHMKKYLSEKPYACMFGVDFLDYSPEPLKPYDRIVMNPPFSKQRDIDHIRHAYSLLKDEGILVSLSSVWVFNSYDDKSREFIAWLKSLDAEIVHVQEGAFRDSGTLTATKIIKLVKR